MADGHDAKRGVHSLPALKPGTTVILQDGCTDTRKKWRVVEQYGRQVGVSDGKRILLRNRQHVRQYNGRAEEHEQDSLRAWTQAPTPRTPEEAMPNNGTQASAGFRASEEIVDPNSLTHYLREDLKVLLRRRVMRVVAKTTRQGAQPRR